MLQISAPHGISLAGNRPEALVVDDALVQLGFFPVDQAKAAYHQVKDAVTDAAGAVWDKIVDAKDYFAEDFIDDLKKAGRLACQYITYDKLQEIAAYAALYPDPQVQTALAAYQGIAAGCNMAFPPLMPPPPPSGGTSPVQTQQATSILTKSIYGVSAKAGTSTTKAGSSSASSFVTPGSSTKPWYARWETYAVVAAAGVAVGGGVMLARRGRRR